MIEEELYVACILLRGRRALVVGNGPMAEEKVQGLELCGAEVRRVDPGDYNAADLEGRLLVVAATTDRDLNERLFADAEARSMLVNVADVPDLCNFILPAIVRDHPVTVGVSTAGASPALAQRMKREISERFGPEYARLAALLDDVRDWAKENLPSYEARRDFFAAIVNADPDPIELLRSGDEGAVRSLIESTQRDALGAPQR